MSNIRVTYSGLIGFTVGIISVFTGIIFTLIVTRRLTPEEFGIWSIIGGMIAYFLIAEPIISYWSTRQIARGEPVGKTSLFSSTIFSFGAVPIYLIFAYFVSSLSSEHLHSMLLASILIPVMFVSQTLAGINLGHKPHAISYGILGFESLKIPAGLTLVYFLDLGVDGAILATMVAFLGKIAIQLYFALPKLRVKFNIQILRRWIKISWIPLYGNLGPIIWQSEVILFPLITGSIVGVAYYSVSIAIAAIIGNAGMISQAIYPKLLAKGNEDYIQQNFTHLMYFAIPLLGIAVIFSKAALFTLNPAYTLASVVVILLSFRSFFYVLNTFFYQILLGKETVDVEKNLNFSSLVKSKLFTVPTIINIHYGLYIGILVFTFFLINSDEMSDLDLVIVWSTITLGLQIPFFIYTLILVRKHVSLSIPYVEILKYMVATIGFVIVFLFTSESIIQFEISIYDFLPGLFAQLAICIGIYLGITYLIDKKTRMFFKAILMELTTKK